MLLREKKKQNLGVKKIRVLKGDQVEVLAGKDKGKKGKIEKVLPGKGVVVIKGINMYKRHVKPQGQAKQGGIVTASRPIALCKVAVICSKCGKKTRVGYEVAKGEKVRICRKCKGQI